MSDYSLGSSTVAQYESCTHCPICHNSELQQIYSDARDYLLQHPGRFRISRCKNCNHEFLSIRPTSACIKEFYQGNYYTHKPAKARYLALSQFTQWAGSQAIKFKNVITRRVIENKKASSGQCVLDYGCGNGRTLKQLKSNGWNVKGYEPDGEARSFANASLSQACITDNPNEILTPTSYDVIILSHVIEHLYDPLDLLLKLRAALKNDGIMILSTPCADCIESKIFGKYWRGYECPRHLHVFSSQSLKQLCIDAGLEVLTIEAEMLPYCFVESIQFVIKYRLKVNLPLLALRIIYLAVYPLSLILMHIGIGSSMKLYLRKSEQNAALKL